MIDETIITINSPSPATYKMWSAFFAHLKLLEIYIRGHLNNCQLIPGLSNFDYLFWERLYHTAKVFKVWNIHGLQYHVVIKHLK